MKTVPPPRLRPARPFRVSLAPFAVTLLLLLPPRLPGQPAPTGTIEGRVQNLVTGRFLHHARVTVTRTGLDVLTDEAGGYRLNRVPAGPVVVEFFYTGLDVQQVTVNVVAGQTVTRDVSLTSVAQYGIADAAVRLDAFQVTASRETDAATIAINEQRFAPNIKNVVSTDTHGEVMGGNIGEFLKFLPGVDAGGGGFEPGAILVRGFPSNFTGVTSDGAPMANSGGDRAFTLEQVSINNVSRVEVTKVPTPATPADSVAGSVNLISKSAFESARTQLRYNVNLTASVRNLKFGAQPRADETYVRYLKPSANLDLVVPVSRNFGFSLALLHYMGNVPFNSPLRTYEAVAAGTGASYSRPYLRQQLTQITTQWRQRDSISTKLDWRVTPSSVLSVSYQQSYFNLDSMNYNFQGNVGTNATPSVAGGVPLSFGPDFTLGATGRASLGQTAGFNIRHQALSAGNLTYRFDNGDWRADALVTASKGKSWTTREDDGFFGGFTTNAKVPVRVSFLDITDRGPGRAEVFTNTNQRFDLYDINNYNLTAASGGRRDLIDGMRAGHLNVKRRLGFLPVPASLQVGWAGREQTRDLQNLTTNYTYNGINGDLSAAAFAAKIYANIQEPLITGIERNPPAGRGVPYASPHLAWQAYEKNPALFTMTPAQAIATERGRRTNSLYFRETVHAAYTQAELRLLNHRLNVLTGVRFEHTGSYGEGLRNDPAAVFARNADGTFARTATGARIRKPEAGAAGSLPELDLTHRERGYTAARAYDGWYPSLHLTWNVTEKFLARAAYARTYGRPNYTEIIPNTVINENDLGTEPDPRAVQGTLTVRNTGLRPWRADNYDLSLEYYTDSGGLFGAGLFHKEITDFFGTFSKVATVADTAALGLDPDYAGWQVNSTINAGDARVSGVEFSASHSLRPLGRWGQYFRGFANYTHLRIRGSNEADFSGFLPRTINWGVTFSRKPFMIMAKWNYRSDVRQDPQAYLGPDAYNYLQGRIQLDLNVAVQIRKNTSLFLNARNATNEEVIHHRYGAPTPAYARSYQVRNYGGATLDAGIKGTF